MLLAAADRPRYETPNAVMHTFAAPSLGSTELSVWEVTMAAGARGPRHSMDHEQVWAVLDGELAVEAGDEQFTVSAGDSLRLPAGVNRQVAATSPARAFVASVAAPLVTTSEGTIKLPWGR